jgi:hypothetical protein
MESTMTKPTVKLIGSDGNAFSIIGACSKAARKAGWNSQQVKEFQTKAMSGDYNALLRTVSENFEIE